MKNWAILGDISFDILSSPHVYSLRSATSWAEHSLIQGKPKLEYVGDELDEITWEILFHNHLTKPEKQLRLLKEAKEKHEPMALVMGDGNYKGPYVITSLDTNVNTTTDGGRTRSATVNLTLREYTGEFKRISPAEGLLDSLLTYIDAKTGTDLKNTAQQAIGYAKTAANVINAGINAYNDIKDNPLSALSSVSQLFSITNQAIPALTQLTALSDVLKDGHELINAGSQALEQVQQAADYITNRDMNIQERIEAASDCMENASSALSQASSNVLALSISTATRKVLA